MRFLPAATAVPALIVLPFCDLDAARCEYRM